MHHSFMPIQNKTGRTLFMLLLFLFVAGFPQAVQWQHGPAMEDGCGNGKIPRVAGGRHVAVDSFSGDLVCRDAGNGVLLWRVPLAQSPNARPSARITPALTRLIPRAPESLLSFLMGAPPAAHGHRRRRHDATSPATGREAFRDSRSRRRASGPPAGRPGPSPRAASSCRRGRQARWFQRSDCGECRRRPGRPA